MGLGHWRQQRAPRGGSPQEVQADEVRRHPLRTVDGDRRGRRGGAGEEEGPLRQLIPPSVSTRIGPTRDNLLRCQDTCRAHAVCLVVFVAISGTYLVPGSWRTVPSYLDVPSLFFL